MYTGGSAPRRVFASGAESEIHETPRGLGVDYTRWDVVDGLAPDAPAAEVPAAYTWPPSTPAARGQVPFRAHPRRRRGAVLRGGSGIFYLHIGDRVYAVLGERGDVLSVPRGTTHWFDMGTTLDFTAVRFFRDPEGWVGSFTGNPISDRIPDFDTIVTERATAVSA